MKWKLEIWSKNDNNNTKYIGTNNNDNDGNNTNSTSMIQLPLPMELATVPAPGSQGTKRSTTAAGYRWCLANNQQNPGAQNGSMNGLTNPLGVWDKGLS